MVESSYTLTGPRVSYDCGCANEVHSPTGALHRVARCPEHWAHYRDPATLDGRYYRELAMLDGTDGLVNTAHAAELAGALGNFPRPNGSIIALEIGSGVSPYVGAVRSAGWEYLGLDASPWACEWVRGAWSAPCFVGDWETMPFRSKVGLILCCHALEHMRDAPAALAKMAITLEPGGELWLEVPDDSDPVNPDHEWFVNCDSLRAMIEAAGLAVERLVARRIVAREVFLFARARRP